jgi:hypothetical protein
MTIVELAAIVCLVFTAAFGVFMTLPIGPRLAAYSNDKDAYFRMFFQQFGAYVVFGCYCIWLHPSIASHVWKLMLVVVLIKLKTVFDGRPPVHPIILYAECFAMLCIGLLGLATTR